MYYRKIGWGKINAINQWFSLEGNMGREDVKSVIQFDFIKFIFKICCSPTIFSFFSRS